MTKCLTAVLAALAAAGLLAPKLANAALQYRLHRVVCGPAAEVRATVSTEIVKWRWMLGKDGKEGVIELWEDPVTGSWSFVQIVSQQEICVISGGYSGAIKVNPLTEGIPL